MWIIPISGRLHETLFAAVEEYRQAVLLVNSKTKSPYNDAKLEKHAVAFFKANKHLLIKYLTEYGFNDTLTEALQGKRAEQRNCFLGS